MGGRKRAKQAAEARAEKKKKADSTHGQQVALPRSNSQSKAMTGVALLASVANAPDGTPYDKPSHQARPPPGLGGAHYGLGP